MGLFNSKKQPELQSTAWDELEEKDLQERIAHLIAFLASTLEGTQNLVVSPGSAESKQFVQEADRTIKYLSQNPPTPAQIQNSRDEFSSAAKEFGKWQSDQVSSFQRETIESLESIVSCVRSNMDGQENTLTDIKSMGARLKQAEECKDINELRKVLLQESQKAKALFESRMKDHVNLRREFDSSISELERKLESVKSAGSKDYLTSCASRAALDFYLIAICSKAQIENKPYSIAMIDIDDFKAVNDLWGHQIGDRVLSFLVQTLQKEFPSKAFIGRYGGDEFVIVATMSSEELETRLLKLTKKLKSAKVPLRRSDADLKLSISAGVAEIIKGDKAEAVIRRADKLLYDAKKDGKSCVKRFLDNAA